MNSLESSPDAASGLASHLIERGTSTTEMSLSGTMSPLPGTDTHGATFRFPGENLASLLGCRSPDQNNIKGVRIVSATHSSGGGLIGHVTQGDPSKATPVNTSVRAHRVVSGNTMTGHFTIPSGAVQGTTDKWIPLHTMADASPKPEVDIVKRITQYPDCSPSNMDDDIRKVHDPPDNTSSKPVAYIVQEPDAVPGQDRSAMTAWLHRSTHPTAKEGRENLIKHPDGTSMSVIDSSKYETTRDELKKFLTSDHEGGLNIHFRSDTPGDVHAGVIFERGPLTDHPGVTIKSMTDRHGLSDDVWKQHVENKTCAPEAAIPDSEAVHRENEAAVLRSVKASLGKK